MTSIDKLVQVTPATMPSIFERLAKQAFENASSCGHAALADEYRIEANEYLQVHEHLGPRAYEFTSEELAEKEVDAFYDR